MRRREDFFNILKVTLNSHFKNTKRGLIISNFRNNKSFVLLIYDKLNAIISEKPSKQVRSFLKTEYNVDGIFFRKLLVYLYLQASFHTKGLFSNKNKIYFRGISEDEIDNTLIYPCNRKIRIFNFISNEIDVITKTGFPLESIKKEIEIRTKYRSINILPLIEFGDNWYREKIINGTPLARIKKTSYQYHIFKKSSLEILHSLFDPYNQTINANQYLKKSIRKINLECQKILAYEPDIQLIIYKILAIILEKNSNYKDIITLKFSHGDFHHGNIWIENETKNIIIIDWETAGLRTEWYDIITLFGGLREINGIETLLKKIYQNEITELSKLIGKSNFANKVFLVLLEDLQFRIDNLRTTPYKIGILEFKDYCKRLLSSLKIYN